MTRVHWVHFERAGPPQAGLGHDVMASAASLALCGDAGASGGHQPGSERRGTRHSADLHRATVTLEDSTGGQGLRLTVHFPRGAEPA